MSGPGSSDGGRGRRRAPLLLAAVALLLLVVGVVVQWGLDGADDEASAGGTHVARGAGGADADGYDDAASASGGGTPRTAETGDPRSSADGTRRARRPTTDSGVAEGGQQGPTKDSSRGAGGDRTARPDSRPRFTLVGEEGAHPNRRFGEDAAIDGDVAVIAAPGFRIGGRTCGAVYVYERRAQVWTLTQRLDSPRTDREGFGRLVGVAGGRIAVFGGTARSSDSQAFRSYVLDREGRWIEEAEVEVRQVGWDAELRGTTAVVERWGAVDVFEVADGRWTLTQSLEAPPDRHPARFGRWLSLLGEVMAVASDDPGRDRKVPVYVYRRTAAGFARETTLWFDESAQETTGALTAGGAVLVRPVYGDPPTHDEAWLSIDEQGAGSWSRPWFGPVRADLHPLRGRPLVGADAGLAAVLVGSGREETVGIALVRRERGGWRQTFVAVPGLSAFANQRGFLALSGRHLIVGESDFGSSADRGGRAWFAEITDEDLARAVPLVPDTPMDVPEDRSMPVGTRPGSR